MTDISVHISEFEKLKDEQIELLGQRDRLRQQTMLILGGGFALMVQYPNTGRLLMFILPVVSYITGMSRVSCDRRIETIGSYIHHVLTPKLQQSENKDGPADVFEWENYIRQDRNRNVRKALDLITNLILYVGSGVLAIGLYAEGVVQGGGPLHLQNWELWAFGFDIFFMLVLFWQIARHAYIHVSSRGEIVPPPQSTHWFGRNLVSGLLAAGTFWLVMHYGPHVLPHFDAARDVAAFGTNWHVTLLTLAASASAFLVLIIGLLGVRR